MKTYYFIGIKGSGMSALAQLLKEEGANVIGSDVPQKLFTQERLEELNILLLNFNKNNIVEVSTKYEDLTVIMGNAYKAHEETLMAKNLGLNIVSYDHFLGQYMGKYWRSIGVSGTHGKTSTTGLLAHVMEGLTSVSYLIGDGTGKGSTNAKYFIYESDEYEGHFLNYAPNYNIITNVEYDHPDWFKDEDDVINTYQKMANTVKNGLIVYKEDPNIKKITYAPKMEYGESNVKNMKVVDGGTKFEFVIGNKNYGEFFIPLYGYHNVLNTLAVIYTVLTLGLDDGRLYKTKKLLASYSGVKRRFSETVIGKNVIIDDYAHHPTEIEATINSMRLKYPQKRVVVVFQPHTYSRTLALKDDFIRVLNKADIVYLTEIYGSREANSAPTITSSNLGKELTNFAGIITKDDVLKFEPNDIVAFLGAGDITEYSIKYK